MLSTNTPREGVSFDSTRLWFPGPTPEGLVFLSDQLEEAAKMYRKSPHDVILFGCTSGSCIKGYGFDKECIERIERASGCPASRRAPRCSRPLKRSVSRRPSS